jgi:hypothetical protein
MPGIGGSGSPAQFGLIGRRIGAGLGPRKRGDARPLPARLPQMSGVAGGTRVFVLEFDWPGLRLNEDTWSGSKVNRLIGEFVGEALQGSSRCPRLINI